MRIDDGFSTTIAIANLPNVKIYEKEVTPVGISGGDPIETTTMRNQLWRTMAPRALKTLTPVTTTVAIDTVAINDIQAQINVQQLFTIRFPDSSTIAFYGFIQEFTPGAFVEGEQPTYTLTIQPTNRHAVNGTESGPIYTEAASA